MGQYPSPLPVRQPASPSLPRRQLLNSQSPPCGHGGCSFSWLWRATVGIPLAALTQKLLRHPITQPKIAFQELLCNICDACGAAAGEHADRSAVMVSQEEGRPNIAMFQR